MLLQQVYKQIIVWIFALKGTMKINRYVLKGKNYGKWLQESFEMKM